MPFALRLVPAAVAACLLASCGGDGGSSSEPPPPPPTPSAGWAVDGYLIGSTVLCDSNGNGQPDAGELSVGTNASGAFTFANGCSAGLVVRGGSSVDTGLPFTGVLRSPAGATVVSPLTTLVVAGMTQAQVLAALGLPGSIDLLNTDPARKVDGALVNGELMKKTLAVQQLVQKTAETLAGLGGATGDAVKQTLYAEVSAAFADVLKGGAVLGTGSTLDQAVVGNLVKAAADRVRSSAAVGSDVKTALQSINSDALAVVAAAGLKVQGEALLEAADAGLAAATLTQQGDGTIAAFIKTNVAQLAAAPTDATAALGATLADRVDGVEPPPPPTNYIALQADSLSLVDGAGSQAYSMAQFQSDAGVALRWPVPTAMTVRLTLAEVGSYAIAADQKLSAAISMTQTVAGGQGELQAYIENVTVRKTAGGLEISVPASAKALVYGVSADGKKRAVIDFANSVAGVSNTLKSAAGSSNSIVFGSVVDYAVNKIGKDFSGIGALRGKYKVSLVVDGLPVRKADGSALPVFTLTVPTALDSSGAVTTSKAVSGLGLVGYVTLTD
jgi:hypothetical protein